LLNVFVRKITSYLQISIRIVDYAIAMYFGKVPNTFPFYCQKWGKTTGRKTNLIHLIVKSTMPRTSQSGFVHEYP
jgi:hypothetical protein